MGNRWRIRPHDAELITRLERSAGISAVLAQLLVGRGIHDATTAREFLDSKLTGLRDPADLPGVADAAARIHAAIAAGRKIVIYGDYDADGMTGTAILMRCLNLLGANVKYFVPSRLDDGYGLNEDALRRLAREGANMVVTVDCGIASVDEADTARQLGLELIITDHHEPAEQLPAAAIVHPRLPGAAGGFGGLCGAGVALKLAWAICQQASQAKRVSPPMREFLLMAVGLAAIGTVADVVPLVDENRILVRHGLVSLRERPPLGVAALMRITGLFDKPALASEDIGFTLGPRLNAAGRLGQAQLGVELLTTDSTERAAALAEYIHGLNSNRETLERSIFLAANKQIKEEFDTEGDAALVVASHDWHAGVIGIVAGRLAERYNRPTVVISIDPTGSKPATGSARSARGVNLHESLAACSEHLLGCGGHAAAAGLRIEPERIDTFRAAFVEHVGEITPTDGDSEIVIDAEAALGQLTLPSVAEMERLAPFGKDNPRPLLCATNVQLAGEPKKMGGGQRHLSLSVGQNGAKMRAVAFGRGDWAESIAEHAEGLDLAYQPVINEFRGRRSVELHLVDWRPTRVAAAAT